MSRFLSEGLEIKGRSITVTDHHIYGFAGLTGDFNPLHTDNIFAQKSTFKGRIAHGLLSLSIGLGLLGDTVEGHFLYGFDKIRFLNPVRPGDTITSIIKVNAVKEKGSYSLHYCTMKLLNSTGTEILIGEIILGKEKTNETS